MADEPRDYGRELLKGLVEELLRRLSNKEEAKAMSAAEGELIRKLCSDGSVTLASIRAGEFGKTAQRVAEEFPFQEGTVVDMGGSA